MTIRKLMAYEHARRLTGWRAALAAVVQRLGGPRLTAAVLRRLPRQPRNITRRRTPQIRVVDVNRREW